MEQMRDVVVLLPGILGSVLRKNNRDVWGLSGGAIRGAVWNLGANIQDLAVPVGQADDPGFSDGVTATKLLPDTHLVPWFWKIDGYTLIAETLRQKFDLRAGENYFEFAYDWRLDNRIAARRLHAESRVWLKNRRAKTGNPNAKLILIGHSMGGLISRYFLEVLEGWRDTSKLITFGTPYAGSLNALSYIANGLKKKVGFFELINLSELVRSFTSAYQLLPTFKCFESSGGYLRLTDDSVSIPNLDRARVRAAFAFHQEIKDAVNRNRQNADYIGGGYKIHPFVGLYQPTAQTAALANGKIEVFNELDGRDTDGDGTVPSISATPFEWTDAQRDAANYVAEQHASLQNLNSILVQVGRVLTNQNIVFDNYKAVAASRIGLEIDDAFHQNESIFVKARSESFAPLAATIENAATNEIVRAADFQTTAGDWQIAEFARLPPATYRITAAEKENRALPVKTVFMVLPSASV